MTLNRRSTSTDTPQTAPSRNSLESFPLRTLVAPAPSSTSNPTQTATAPPPPQASLWLLDAAKSKPAGAATGARIKAEPSPSAPGRQPYPGPDPDTDPESESEPDSAAHTHGNQLATAGEGTVDESSGDDPVHRICTPSSSSNNSAGESMTGPMSGKPPLLRTSSGFRTASYGAISNSSGSDLAEGDVEADNHGGNIGSAAHVANATTSRRNRSGLSYRSSGDFEATRRRIGSERRSSAGRRSSRQSEELSGFTTIGGLEGRFETAETSLLGDMVESNESECEEESEETLDVHANVDGLRESEQQYDSDFDPEHDPPDNSPYAQVRASVPPTDNTSLSINTPRMWFLSVLFSVLGSSTNLFFSLRYPSVAITPVIALLLVHPFGLLWDFVLKRYDDPPEEYIDGVLSEQVSISSSRSSPHRPQLGKHSRLSRLRLWLAQGRWNEKEHSCVYVSSNVSFGFAFATDVIVEQTQFYKQDASVTYQLLLTLSTQILGYTFAGLARRFLVRPSGMIWPGTLMSAAMFSTLHKDDNKEANGWRVSRWTFFFAVWLFAFLFYFFPGLLMPALSYFNVITWFAPDNVVVSNLFGVVSGLGLFPMTFDWAQIAYIGSPLLTPFWAAMNVVGGLVIVMWIIAPIACNWLNSAYMPILSASVFDNTGSVYNVTRILTDDFVFDREAYSKYSRVFLPITYVLSYGVQFAGLAALLTHTICWHGKDIWQQWKNTLDEAKEETKAAYAPVAELNEEVSAQSRRGRSYGGRRYLSRSSTSMENLMSREDVHNRLMKRYKDAPMSWYLMTFFSMLAIGIFVVEYYPIHLPWYGLLLALGICTVLFIPIGIIMAVTNQHSSIYLICQLVAGVVFPGRPVANMVFVTYGYISSAQGIKFAADLKLGHYMKIPPRILFSVQMVATIVSSFTQIIVLNWMFRNVPGLCTPQAINGFTCPIARVHFNGSILWGVVGPSEFFGPNATYRGLVWAFLIGALLPIPLWLYGRKRKDSIVRKINLPVLFGSLGWIPPASGLNFSVWALVCYLFNYLVKRRAPAWWAKYTMTLSAALDSGLAFGIVVVFFGFLYPGWMNGFSWWGTEVYKQGCDWKACSFLKVPQGEHFGPDAW